MNWIFYLKRSWINQGTSPAQHLLMRATMEDEDGDLVASNIIELYVFAMDFYVGLPENPLSEPKHQHIYHEELSLKDYYLEELEINESEDYMLRRAVLYLKAERFDQTELLDWAKTCLLIWGFEHGSFEAGDRMDFAEVDPLLSLFSVENARKFEDKFGKDWWKRKDP